MRLRAALLALFTAATTLAGCADPPDAGVPDVGPGTQYEDDAVAVTIPVLARDPPLPGERTLDSAPQWRLGEWWRYRMTDHFTGTEYEFMRIVAGEDRRAGKYLVGFPLEEFSNDVLIFHVPGYGDISQSDLSFETHDVVFQPLQFPLAQGASWPVSFEGVANGLATVTAVGEGTADIVMEVSAYGFINATYDAAYGEITRLHIKDYATYEVIGHGYGYADGPVRVPHDHDLVFFHGRYAGVADVQGTVVPPTISPPTEEVEVAAEYDRLSFVIMLGPGALGLGDPSGQGTPPPGYFSERVTAPDNTVYEMSMLPGEGALKIGFFGAELPVGTWMMEHTAAGVGAAFVEGIGYHSIDIDMPSGCVIESVNAGHHVGACRVEDAGGQPSGA